jgi:hypothetical protein
MVRLKGREVWKLTNGKSLFKKESHPVLRSLGIPIYNSTLHGEGFYVSYNNSRRDYGCVTTALVTGQMEKFYILKGDHREQYAELVGKGLDECLAYFKAHLDEAHDYSDSL